MIVELFDHIVLNRSQASESIRSRERVSQYGITSSGHWSLAHWSAGGGLHRQLGLQYVCYRGDVFPSCILLQTPDHSEAASSKSTLCVAPHLSSLLSSRELRQRGVEQFAHLCIYGLQQTPPPPSGEMPRCGIMRRLQTLSFVFCLNEPNNYVS